MNKLLKVLLLAVLPLFVLACGIQGLPGSAAQLSSIPPMIEPGDKIASMVITTGAEDAPPLWAFCSPAQHLANTTTSDCSVPVIPRLAIGHIIMPGDDTLTRLDWSEISWQLTIDGLPVDLKRFRSHDFVLPAMSHDPSPVREVFVQFTAWNIVLTDLKPGHHTLWFVAQSKLETYTWFVSLQIEPVDETIISWRPFPLPSYVESIK